MTYTLEQLSGDIKAALKADPGKGGKQAAAKEGILVLLPFQHAELPESAFLDGAHLNPQGAALFTERLGPALLQSLYQN